MVKRNAVAVYANDWRARTAAGSVCSLCCFFLLLPLALASVRQLGARLLTKARPKCEHVDGPHHRNDEGEEEKRKKSGNKRRSHGKGDSITPILYFLIPFLKQKHSLTVLPSVDAGEAALLVFVVVTTVTHAKHKRLLLLAFSAFSESRFPVFVVLAKRHRCVLCWLQECFHDDRCQRLKLSYTIQIRFKYNGNLSRKNSYHSKV